MHLAHHLHQGPGAADRPVSLVFGLVALALYRATTERRTDTASPRFSILTPARTAARMAATEENE